MDVSDKVSWNRISDTQWQTKAHRAGNWVGTITLGAGANPYSLTISGGGGTTTWPTLRNAKNAFRRFLFDKPVQ